MYVYIYIGRVYLTHLRIYQAWTNVQENVILKCPSEVRL